GGQVEGVGQGRHFRGQQGRRRGRRILEVHQVERRSRRQRGRSQHHRKQQYAWVHRGRIFMGWRPRRLQPSTSGARRVRARRRNPGGAGAAAGARNSRAAPGTPGPARPDRAPAGTDRSRARPPAPGGRRARSDGADPWWEERARAEHPPAVRPAKVFSPSLLVAGAGGGRGRRGGGRGRAGGRGSGGGGGGRRRRRRGPGGRGPAVAALLGGRGVLLLRPVEVRVPAAALEDERSPADHLLQRPLGAAGRARLRGRIVQLLEDVGQLSTLLADVFVDGHGSVGRDAELVQRSAENGGGGAVAARGGLQAGVERARGALLLESLAQDRKSVV